MLPFRQNAARLPGRTGIALAACLALAGCGWHTPSPSSDHPGGLDLSDLAGGASSWTPRRGEARIRQPGLRAEEGIGSYIALVPEVDRALRFRRKVRWDAEHHPLLAWKWRVRGRLDSVALPKHRPFVPLAALDVTLASSFGFPKTVRYVWSADGRDDKANLNRDNWHPKVVVLRDRADGLGAWRPELVDVWADFQRLWGYTPRHSALSISVVAFSPPGRNQVEVDFATVTALSQKASP